MHQLQTTDSKSDLHNLENLLNELEKTKQKHDSLKKAHKKRFSFFQGLVNSGKSDKTHIEKYHSNFIAYLLNPGGQHDCEDLFLKRFWELLKKVHKDFQFNLNDDIIVEREEVIKNQKRIDITIKSEEWIVFIENKVNSVELENQVADYSEYCQDKYKLWLGIYLSKNGDFPKSMDKSQKNILALSYKNIIVWLKLCRKDLKKYSNVTTSLTQYIDALNQLINPMNPPEINDMVNLIAKSPENIRSAFNIISNEHCIRQEILKQLACKVKSKQPLVEEFKLIIDNNINLNFYIKGWDHHLIHYSTSKETADMGIYRKDYKACNQIDINDKSDYQSTVSNIREIFQKEMGGYERWVNWVWVRGWEDFKSPWWELNTDRVANNISADINQICELINSSGIKL